MPPLESVSRVFELAAITRGLQRLGITTLALKGPALSQLLYGDPHRRPCRDLDLLARQTDTPAVLEYLRRAGYVADAPFSGLPAGHLVRHTCEIPLRHAEKGVKVDLHWALAVPHYPLECSIDALFDSAREVRLASTGILTPHSVPLLRYLAFHGAKHVWEKPVWIEDIAALLGILDADARASVLRDPDPCVQLALELAHRSHGSQRGTPDPSMGRLASSILRRGGAPPATSERIELCRQLGVPLRRLVRHWLGCAVIPTEPDWAWVRLPRRLVSLYPVVRLVRLAVA